MSERELRRNWCRSRRRRSEPDRGSTLLLFPAAVLVLMVLAAIAVDLSTVHLARRELYRSASQAVDDAAAALDQDAFRSGVTRLDRSTAERIARYQLASSTLPGRLSGPPVVTFDSDTSLIVTVSMEVDRFFGRTIRGTPRTDVVTVTVRGALIDQEARR